MDNKTTDEIIDPEIERQTERVRQARLALVDAQAALHNAAMRRYRSEPGLLLVWDGWPQSRAIGVVYDR